MTEKSHIWKPMRDNITSVHWTRIENVAVTGAPDVHGMAKGVDAWIENKIFEGNKIHFRPSQIAWHTKRLQMGGKSWVIARKLDTLLLYSSHSLRALIDAGVAAIDGVTGPRADLLVLEDEAVFATSKPFNWETLRQVLFEHHLPYLKDFGGMRPKPMKKKGKTNDVF